MGERFKSAAAVLESVVSARQASAFTIPEALAELMDRLAELHGKAGNLDRSREVAEQAHLVRNPPPPEVDPESSE